MLKIVVPASDLFDEANDLFIQGKEQVLQLEHSLVSLSKWESKWKKPFLSKDDKTLEETIDYIKCMTITQNVDDTVYYRLTNENILAVNAYIDNPMTATSFGKEEGRGSKEVITAEIIYYWMIAHTIPFECQKWHLNRLLTLVRVCNIKNAPAKKMSKRDAARRNAELNAQRRAALKTGG